MQSNRDLNSNNNSVLKTKQKNYKIWGYNCILIISFISAIFFLSLGIYVLKHDNPQRLKYIKLEKEFKYDSKGNYYLRSTSFLNDTIYSKPDDDLGSSFGTFIIALKYSNWDNYGWRFFRYEYSDNLSIYRIGLSESVYADSICKECRLLIKNYMDSLDISYEKLKNKRYRIQYSPFVGHWVLKTIIVENNNIYELTSAWKYKSKSRNENEYVNDVMLKHHNSILEDIITTKMGEYISKTQNRIILYLAVFLLSFLVFIVFCKRIVSIIVNSLNDKKLWSFIFLITLTNLLIFCIQFILIYNNKISHDKYTFSYLYLFASTLLIMNMPMLAFISNKMRNNNYDYLLIDSIKNYLKNRTQSIKEYKSIISLEVYPFFILGSLPMGIFILPLWTPYVIIQIILLELRRWIIWIYAEEDVEKENKLLKKNVNLAVIALILFIIFIIVITALGLTDDILKYLNIIREQKESYSYGWY